MRFQTFERCVATISGAKGSSLTHFAYDPRDHYLLKLEVHRNNLTVFEKFRTSRAGLII